MHTASTTDAPWHLGHITCPQTASGGTCLRSTPGQVSGPFPNPSTMGRAKTPAPAEMGRKQAVRPELLHPPSRSQSHNQHRSQCKGLQRWAKGILAPRPCPYTPSQGEESFGPGGVELVASQPSLLRAGWHLSSRLQGLSSLTDRTWDRSEPSQARTQPPSPTPRGTRPSEGWRDRTSRLGQGQQSAQSNSPPCPALAPTAEPCSGAGEGLAGARALPASPADAGSSLR